MASMKEFLAQRKAEKAQDASQKPKRKNCVPANDEDIITFACGHKTSVKAVQAVNCLACRKVKKKERNKAVMSIRKASQGRPLPDNTTISILLSGGEWLMAMDAGTEHVEVSGHGEGLARLIERLFDRYNGRDGVIKEELRRPICV